MILDGVLDVLRELQGVLSLPVELEFHLHNLLFVVGRFLISSRGLLWSRLVWRPRDDQVRVSTCARLLMTTEFHRPVAGQDLGGRPSLVARSSMSTCDGQEVTV